ncbi:glycosyltransferase family 4 protein [Ornithinimicrobium ciconiae]|uniref:Glycosyltransferase family 4 protein n=1 Tax=Ornithinimicrobium ciconiae TaxID=2594265 RepID=A0A516G7A7_9MICO|nr:glycosyltransferase family 4 protein [Ornithinimicrobium ciconiae]QDO87416.1 glycosyltransferase family 4 protein [Ornithinimicrobium ciconiae]
MADPTMITFVSHTNEPGGGELALRRYLDATQVPVRLVTLEGGGVWEGARFEVVTTSGLPDLRQELRASSLIIANSMRAAFLVALLAPRRAHLVYWVRDGLIDSAMSRVALTLTKQVTARRMSRYLANSEWTKRTVLEALGVRPNQVDVVQSMCGVAQADLRHLPREVPQSDAPLRLLYLGRLSPWKAPDVAVHALAALGELGVDASLTVAGSSLFGEEEYAKALATLVATEPNASLVGHVNDVRKLLDSHDVLVHCSTVPEPFGQVVVQGLAAGLPVVATAAGGPCEILRSPPIDLLYQPGNADSLASMVVKVVRNYAEVATWALARAHYFTDEVAVAHTDTTLRNLQATGEAEQSRSPN